MYIRSDTRYMTGVLREVEIPQNGLVYLGGRSREALEESREGCASFETLCMCIEPSQ